MLDQVGGTGTKTSGTFKIKGGNCGRGAMPPGSPGYEAAFYSPDIDPHAQKGTGAHFANIWRLDAGTTLLLDVNKEQRFGAGCQTTGLQGTSAKPITLADPGAESELRRERDPARPRRAAARRPATPGSRGATRTPT